MISHRQIFFQHVGQTSQNPIALEIVKAEGIYMYDNKGKKYIDLVSGVSVSNVGHRHPKVVKAVKDQLDKYMHLMVYGEYIQSPQVKFAELLTQQLPEKLNAVYFVNSGSEAIEGAMKLAKRYTGKPEIIAFKNAYHGSTHGALSLMNNENLTQAFRPLVPGISFLDFNDISQISKITEHTAAVVIEAIQAEGGIIPADYDFMKALRKHCDETGTLLIIDEIQTGFGRTGKLFAFEHYDIVPDIICIAKGMGGGMPIGAFVADTEIMKTLTFNPALGHITTFGGHPVSAAGALASLEIIIENNLSEEANRKGQLYINALKNHPKVKSVRGNGLFLAFELEGEGSVEKVINKGVELGFISDAFLFDNKRFRIAPPLTITDDEISISVELVRKALDEL
ncbi:MAG: aspartate aminotransferase family protein [Bacteroidales bacterium]|nr:aspartate aminotransferase family protein [Bacteroidales bacterium]